MVVGCRAPHAESGSSFLLASGAFAEDLVKARIITYQFENPDWELKYRESEIVQSRNKAKEQARRMAEEEAERKEAEQKKKSSYRSYVPRKRCIIPDLKRFKGPGER